MDTLHTIKTLAESLGTDYFGIADLSGARNFILMQGGPALLYVECASGHARSGG